MLHYLPRQGRRFRDIIVSSLAYYSRITIKCTGKFVLPSRHRPWLAVNRLLARLTRLISDLQGLAHRKIYLDINIINGS